MKPIRLLLLLLTLSFSMQAIAAPPGAGLKQAVSAEATLSLEPIDFAKVRAEDAAAGNGKSGQAMRYGVPFDFDHVKLMNGRISHGEQITLDDGRILWRWAVLAPDASSLDFGFSRYHLPEGAELYVYAPDLKVVRGPYTDADNEKHGQLWTPVVPGQAAIVELVAPAEMWPYVELKLSQVVYGYLDFWNPDRQKAETCNFDSICPEGDFWRQQDSAIAAYGFGGGRFCTGQLINNTSQDNRPLFLSANHCQINAGNAPSMVFYWNYESDQCRTPNTSGNGQVLNPNIAVTQSGASFVASHGTSDFLLVELDDEPPAAADVFYGGWDRRDRIPDMSISFHHPNGDEKRLARDDDPADVGDTPGYLGVPIGTDTHIEIQNYEAGTTEGGSSGSALWNQNRRIVGWLSGGGAACSVNIGDDYGRMFAGWTGGGTSSQRLRDHLDPDGTNVNFINGKGSCDAPTVTIVSSANPANVGQNIGFSANVSGGQGALDYEWDFDGDGVTDWNQADLSGAPNDAVRYPGAFNGNVTLRVTDATGCEGTDSLGQVVRAPALSFGNASTPVEICGDGDLRVEPSEIFETTISVTNSGDRAAQDSWLVFARSMSGSTPVAGPDSFGYTAFDSDSGNCTYDFTNISGSGTSLTFDPSGQFDPLDDGGTTVQLGGSGFPFYGNNRSQLVMSTNGYLSTNGSDGGGDFSNDCPIPTSVDIGGGARIMPLHDDLIIGAGYYQYFGNCPRPGEAGNGGCHIFQWEDVGFFGAQDVNFDMQTILYEDSGQIVYQYGPGNTPGGAEASIGIQNQSASTGVEYACNDSGAVSDNSAVCLFAPNNQPPSAVVDGVRLLTPAADLNNFQINETNDVTLRFKVEDSVACGSTIAFDAHGLTFPEGFAPGEDGIFSVTVGGANGQCNASANCPVDIAQISPNQGLYNSPLRDGNGVDTYINEAGGMVGTWYTGNQDHSPVWYTSSNQFMDNQMDATLFKVNRAGNGNISVTDVGRVLYTFIDEGTALYNFDLNGVRSGEYINEFVFGMGGPRGDGTGHYFAPSESGWGTVVNQRGDTELNTFYFYDSGGEPIWSIGLTGDVVNGSSVATLVTSNVVCPGCPWIPQRPTAPIGTLTHTFDVPAGTCPNANANDLLVNTDISLPAPLSGNWDRTNICKEALSAPVNGN